MTIAFPSRVCANAEQVFAPNMERITPLDEVCPVNCNLLAVPVLVLDPDQRDINFPPITPNQDIRVGRAGGCIPVNVVSPTVVGSTLVASSFAADTSEWERANRPTAPIAAQNIQMTRMAFDNTAGVIYSYFRTTDYDSCGSPIRIGPETRVEFAQTGGCPNASS